MSKIRLLVLAMAVAIGGVAIQTQSAPSAAAAANPSQAAAVLKFAENQIGKRFQMGAEGPTRYDCSGLVYRSFQQSGVLEKIGGSRKTARAYYKWFSSRGLASKANPRPGDLVVWAYPGKPVSHMGIFVGYNRYRQPMAVSALVNPYGVSLHKVSSINVPLKAYLHVNLAR